MTSLLTIGHSTHSVGEFTDLCIAAGVTAIADVRSHPRSRHVPHADRERLGPALAEAGLSYVFLGDLLGGRPDAAAAALPRDVLYPAGPRTRPDYRVQAGTAPFRRGIQRLAAGVNRGFTVAVMCSEEDPTACHRTLLIGRYLTDPQWHGEDLPDGPWDVTHVRGDGSLVRQPVPQPSLFG